MMAIIENIQELVQRGRYLEARALAADALKTTSSERLCQLYALALSKSGAPEAAREFLEPRYAANPDDPETAGILGGIYKELFRKNQQTQFAVLSRDTYLKNFQATGNYYTGINTAAMSAMVMQAARAREVATKVVAGIEAETQQFWELATLGEAYLLLKDRERALNYYVQARRVASADWGKIMSVYNQLWLLNHFIAVPKDVLSLFSPPRVAAFVGHMVDRPDRAQPRFPESCEAQVRDALRASIQSLRIQVGICALACGSDILFAETLLEAGGEVNAVLPFQQDDFEEISVRFAGQRWVDRFHRLLARVPCTFVTRERYAGHDDLFSLQTKVIFGNAILRSQAYHNEPFLITVLSETDLQRKKGGTRDAVSLWPFPANMANINPENFASRSGPVGSTTMDRAISEQARPVCYLVRFDIHSLNAMDQRKLERNALQAAENENVRVVNEGDWRLICFPSPTLAFSFLRQMLLDFGKGSALANWRMVAHAGPVDWTNPTASEALIRIRQLCDFSTPSQFCATVPFASVLALESRLFQITFSGAIQTAETGTEMVYQVVLSNT